MRKATKIWLVIAAILVIAGLIAFTSAMMTYSWDFTKLTTEKYETNTYEIKEAVSSISMNTDTADILFVSTDDKTRKVVCYEQDNVRHTVDVQDGTLLINVVDNREWHEYIGINFKTPKITVYLPQGEYGSLSVNSSTGDIEISKEFKFQSIDISESTGDVMNYACVSDTIKIHASTGSIRIENVSAGALDLSVTTGGITVSGVKCTGDVKINVSTGKAKLTDVQCKNLTSSGDTGDISLTHVIAAEKFSIKRSTGDVRFDGSDAAEIFVETDTGDVTGTLLSGKLFITNTDTGDIDVPKTATGGKCEISTDTGDITITVA